METVATPPPLPSRARDANKGSCGRVLVVGGSRGMAGAPCLAARAALRSGAGLVRIAVPAPIWDVVATKTDECLTDGLPATARGTLAAAAIDELLELCAWADVVVLGPGLTQDAETVDVIRRVVQESQSALVLDADGLNAYAGGRICHLRNTRRTFSRAPLVLTPHPGEMARLLQKPVAEVQAERTRAVQTCAEWSGAICVLKGAATLVCDGAKLFTNTTGNPGLATGGTGDVLTGVIAALLGQGLDGFGAACLGVHLHGLSGDRVAARLGEWGLIAGDLVCEMPLAFVEYAGRPRSS